MAKRLGFGMLGAYTPSGSNKPGSTPLPKPGTGGQNLVDKIRNTGGGLRGARSTPAKKKTRKA